MSRDEHTNPLRTAVPPQGRHGIVVRELDELYLETGPREHAKPLYERVGFQVTHRTEIGDYAMTRRNPHPR